LQNLPVARLAVLGFVTAMTSFALFDDWFYNLVLVSDPEAREVWETITDLGDSGWMLTNSLAIWALALGISRFAANRERWQMVSRSALFIFAGVAIPGIIAMTFKGLIGRARPYLHETEGPRGFDPFAFEPVYSSFPSGHTTTAFAMATVVTFVFPKAGFVAFPLAILAGFSRSVLGAHYLADVIMGATLGTLGAIMIYRWLAPKLKL